MGEYKFYYPDGKEITDKVQFIEFYSRVYRYVNRKQWGLEVEMENLLGRNKGTRLITENIARILFWKANEKPKPPEDEGYRIVNRSRTIIVWDNPKELSEMNRFTGSERKIDVRSAKDFVSYFTGYGYASRAKDKTSGELVTNPGIGSVYAITLLFFATKGAYPIYDKFAHIGLRSVMEGRNPTDEHSKITDSRYGKMFRSANRKGGKPISDEDLDDAWTDYLGYKANLMEKNENPKGVFADEYDEDVSHYRDIDRALWAYGHLIKRTFVPRCLARGWEEWGSNA